MDPELPNIDYEAFNMEHDGFMEHYRDAEEHIQNDTPKPRGLPVWITCYCDSSHAANKVTRKSHTGIVIFLNRAPIQWYSKRQQTIETSACSSEFIAMKVCIEMVRALRYRLRMFGIPIWGQAHIFVITKPL